LQAQIDRRSELGILVGDPVALCLELPTQQSSSLNIHAGIWTWGLWHDIAYNTPYLSADHVWYLPPSHPSRRFYVGGGIAVFFRDNPKDDRDYGAAVAVRLPLGFTFYAKGDFSIGFELAPIYQVAPQYSFRPYVIDLNGGLLLSLSL
jgi:hypothetical protein